MDKSIDFSEPRDRLLYGRLAVLLTGDICRKRLEVFTVRRKARAHGLGIKIDGYNLVSGCQELTGAGVADTASGSRYQNRHPSDHVFHFLSADAGEASVKCGLRRSRFPPSSVGTFLRILPQ